MKRSLNIVCRTLHIAITGVLFGGHMFGVDPERLLPWLYLAIASGGCLIVLEAFPDWRWLFELRAAFVVAKLLLLCLIPWLWPQRVAILVVVIVIASAGSHMTRGLRHYSWLHTGS